MVASVDSSKEQDMDKCRNCDDGCTAVRFCDGCDETLCEGCWAEHNEDAPCHDEVGHEDSLTIVRGS